MQREFIWHTSGIQVQSTTWGNPQKCIQCSIIFFIMGVNQHWSLAYRCTPKGLYVQNKQKIRCEQSLKKSSHRTSVNGKTEIKQFGFSLLDSIVSLRDEQPSLRRLAKVLEVRPQAIKNPNNKLLISKPWRPPLTSVYTECLLPARWKLLIIKYLNICLAICMQYIKNAGIRKANLFSLKKNKKK